ncbi:Type II secretory pathway, ATPase PulE/Tfp pilus assembly pathway, ATPase PilB [Escherichia coli CE418]|nr:bacteriophage N4 adsorption B domain protein [Escherichia coli 1827-70]EGJ91747.1 bacteriophage N4 adsorption protein B domain protein [Shigella flexneri 2747-71]EHW34926.1 bacteriophage N4 receptor, outer membrane domain protein [Escherichia coli DEC8E]EHX34979.1 bacteriophage N4 receptor, outer membrane domain protein [Escherichia coli DEC12B]EMW28580.1 putative bacteriophage N4 adsorption protein B [Escherichia coli 2848050]EST00715.1 Type II secretory pathway, ATPase PulE/Tfp pilus asse
MDWLLDVFATWLYGLKVIAITLAVIMFISGLDDFLLMSSTGYAALNAS